MKYRDLRGIGTSRESIRSDALEGEKPKVVEASVFHGPGSHERVQPIPDMEDPESPWYVDLGPAPKKPEPTGDSDKDLTEQEMYAIAEKEWRQPLLDTSWHAHPHKEMCGFVQTGDDPKDGIVFLAGDWVVEHEDGRVERLDARTFMTSFRPEKEEKGG